MQKIIVMAIVSLALLGCSSKPPSPPEPKGDFIPVNPIEIYLSDLKL